MLVIIVSCAVLLPLLLLAAAWRQRKSERIAYAVLIFSTFLLPTAFVHSVKVTLLGPDYSDRLYFSIDLNMGVAIVFGIYLASTRQWTAAIAALILALEWFLVAGINSVA